MDIKMRRRIGKTIVLVIILSLFIYLMLMVGQTFGIVAYIIPTLVLSFILFLAWCFDEVKYIKTALMDIIRDW